MKKSIKQLLSAACVLGLAGLPALASAQGLDQLKGALGGAVGGGSDSGGGSGLSSLGGLMGGNVSSGSTSNAAGVLEFCVKNNYLGGDASSVKDQLMSKIGGGSAQPAQQDTGFLSGAKGMLTSGDGKSLDLSGGGLKKELTKQVCDKILAQGKSLL